jgi:hypothetical protein
MTDTTITIPPSEDTDPNAVAGLLKDYRGALSKTREQIAGVQANRGDVTQRNLAAIDEAIAGLKASRQTGPIAFDPAVSAAMSAGFLKTTPGVAGNFMSELGSAMGNAAPVIGNLDKNNRDSFAILADLQRKRGEFEAEPLKEREANLQKTSDQTLKMIEQLEAAGVKSPRPTVNPNNGDVIYPNAFGPGKYGIVRQSDPQNMYEVGGTGSKPMGGPGTTTPPKPPEAPTEKVAFLQTVLGKGFDPSTWVDPSAVDIDKLAQIAAENPAYARRLWSVLEYRLDPKTVTDQRRTKEGVKTLLDDATEIDKQYDHTGLANRKKGEYDWTNGPDAAKVTSLKTGINHLGELMEAAAGLQNGDAQFFNKIKNWAEGQAGSPAPAEFSATVKFVGDELAKYLSGAGSVAEGSKEEIASIFSGVQAPDQIQGAVRKVVSLLEKKAGPMADQKTKAFGNRRKYDMNSLLEESGAVAKKIKETDITTPEGQEAWGVKPKPPERDPGKAWNGPDGKPLVPHQSRAGDLTYQGGDPKDKRNWAKE